jgi:hypothetical protein
MKTLILARGKRKRADLATQAVTTGRHAILLSRVDAATARVLFAAIASYAAEHGSSVTKTKLLKLLYLFDVEFYRVHRKIFTGFSWKFFHLGPWASEYDSTLEGIIATDALLEQFGKHDTTFYRSPEYVDPAALRLSARDESILRGVLRRWATAQTSEILDYVYFDTEPMQNAIRNEPLDFSLISEAQPLVYKRTSSGVSAKEIKKKRQIFQQKYAQMTANREAFFFAPPRYDEEFARAIATLETEE